RSGDYLSLAGCCSIDRCGRKPVTLRMGADELPHQGGFPSSGHAKQENARVSIFARREKQIFVPEGSIGLPLRLDPLKENLHDPTVKHALGLGASSRGMEARIGEEFVEFGNQSVRDRAILGAQSLPHFPTRLALIRWVQPKGMAEVHDQCATPWILP